MSKLIQSSDRCDKTVHSSTVNGSRKTPSRQVHTGSQNEFRAHLRVLADDDASNYAFVSSILTDASISSGHPFEPRRVNLVAKIDDEIVGGLYSQVFYDWLWVTLLAVSPEKRGMGIGRSLMCSAESYARQHTLLGINLDTFGYQAATFYRKLGFNEVSRLRGRVEAEDRIFLAKRVDTSV